MIDSLQKSLQDIISSEITNIFLGIFSVLILCSISFHIYKKVSKKTIAEELLTRTKSWWIIAIGFAVLAASPSLVGAILISYLSFVALREMLSIIPLRTTDRTGLFISYFAIPGQYYFAWQNQHTLFLIFIPLIMFIIIPFLLVLTGNMNKVGRSMSIIPTILILTVFLLSHVVMILHFDFHEYGIGGSELIVYLIVLTAFNDVFQFTWGKILGRHPILPNVSPNKTWEGFIGGALTTACLGYGIRFLTPFNGQQAFMVALSIGIIGFIGDALISAIKRDLKLKDTSNLIPGHGGAMDRLDSLFLTAPLFYHTIYLMYD